MFPASLPLLCTIRSEHSMNILRQDKGPAQVTLLCAQSVLHTYVHCICAVAPPLSTATYRSAGPVHALRYTKSCRCSWLFSDILRFLSIRTGGAAAAAATSIARCRACRPLSSFQGDRAWPSCEITAPPPSVGAMCLRGTTSLAVTGDPAGTAQGLTAAAGAVPRDDDAW